MTILLYFQKRIGGSIQSTVDACLQAMEGQPCLLMIPPSSESLVLPDKVVAACMPTCQVHALSMEGAKVFSEDRGVSETVQSVGRLHRPGEAHASSFSRKEFPHGECPQAVTISNLLIRSNLSLQPSPTIFHTGQPYRFWHGNRAFSLGLIGLQLPRLLHIKPMNVNTISPPFEIVKALGNVITATRDNLLNQWLLKTQDQEDCWVRVRETGQIGRLVGGGSRPDAPAALQNELTNLQPGQNLEVVSVEYLEPTPLSIKIADEEKGEGMASMRGMTWTTSQGTLAGGSHLPHGLTLSLS